jgi:hypothetical protein
VVSLQLLRERNELLYRLDKRPHLGQLRPDVHLQALDFQVRKLRRRRIRRRGELKGNSKLVVALARGDLGVRLCVHIRVDPDRDRRLPAELAGHMIDPGEFGLALDMKRKDPSVKRQADVGLRLAHTCKYTAINLCACGLDPAQLTATHEIKRRAEVREQPQQREIRIRL